MILITDIHVCPDFGLSFLIQTEYAVTLYMYQSNLGSEKVDHLSWLLNGISVQCVSRRYYAYSYILARLLINISHDIVMPTTKYVKTYVKHHPYLFLN